MASFLDLEEAALVRIFHFNGSAVDLSRLASTCTALRCLLTRPGRDDVWKYCSGALTGPEKTHRERALSTSKITFPLDQVRSFQEKAGPSFFLSTMGVNNFRDLVSTIGAGLGQKPPFYVRGDTLGQMAEMLQAWLVDRLTRASRLARYVASNKGQNEAAAMNQPTVEVTDIDIAAEQCSTQSELNSISVNGTPPLSPLARCALRKIAYQAGVAYLGNEVFEHLWKTSVCRAIKGLLVFAGMYSDGVFPVPKAKAEDKTFIVLTPVLLDLAATRLHFPIVYGDTWADQDGKTAIEEQQELHAMEEEWDESDEHEVISSCSDPFCRNDISFEQEDSEDEFSMNSSDRIMYEKDDDDDDIN